MANREQAARSDELQPLGPPARLREDRIAQLAAAVVALCGAETQEEVVEIVRSSARSLCGAYGVAVIFRETDSSCCCVAEDSPAPVWAGQRQPLAACISGWAMEHAEQVVIRDVHQDPRVQLAACRQSGVRSLVMTPVGSPRPLAALGAFWLEVRDHSDEEITVLRALAECMAAALRTVQLRASLEQRLAESEQRRREREAARSEVAFQAQLLDVVEQAVVATDPEGRVIYWNAFAEKLYGWTKAEVQGRKVTELRISASTEPTEVRRRIKAIREGGAWGGYVVLRRKDGATFPASVYNWPVTNEAGEIVAIVGVSVDDTARKAVHDHQQLLINELNHRVKNILAIVQSIASQSLRGEQPLAHARRIFEARLYALAAAHGLMVNVGWRPVSVRALAQTALEPFGYQRATARFKVEGPDLSFSPRTGVSFSLAVHELGTNAMKHGALSTSEGQVDLRWWVDEDAEAPQLHIEWRERQGPAVQPPLRRGFGSRLIEHGLALELGGAASLAFEPDGLICRIVAPAERALADERTSHFPLPA